MTKYVLSLDGGGVRGLSSATFLKNLEDELGEPINKKFDLICGSSTGGILAIALSLLNLDSSSLADLYSSENLKRIFSKKTLRIFGAKYGASKKNDVLIEYFGKLLLSDAATATVAVTYDLKNRSTKLFASYEDVYVDAWKVAAATSAAPTYFPAVQISENWYVDGSISTNNPVLIAFSEAKKLWPYENIKVLSIGTGYDSKSFNGIKTKNWGIFSWLKGGIMQVLMESNSEHLIANSLYPNNYMRINSRLVYVNHEFDDTSGKNLLACKDMGKVWWKNYGKKTINFISTD